MKITCGILFIASVLVIGTHGGSSDYSESSLLSESSVLISYLSSVELTTSPPTTTGVPSGGGLPNNICSPYVAQYLSLSSAVRTKLYDFISANQRISFELLAGQTKDFIGTLLSDSSLSASDAASLSKFMTEELIPGVSTIVCFLAYELDKMPAAP